MSGQEVTRTRLKRGCVRSFHELQKQTESEMKGLILIRLEWNSKCAQYLYITRIDLKSWYELNMSISFDTATLHFVMFLSVILYALIKCLPRCEQINCE